jgi:uncharacterized membrane protein YdbT with pleckstrin-like domain
MYEMDASPSTSQQRDVEEIVFFSGHPSWRSTLDFHAKGILAAVVAGALAGSVTAIVSGHVMAEWIVAVVLVALLIVLLAGVISRSRTTYTITSERLTIHQGLMSRDLHQTRLDRIQNVNARQSVFERLLRVGTVDFDTAAGAGYDFTFHGVDNPREIVRTVERALREQAHWKGDPHP